MGNSTGSSPENSTPEVVRRRCIGQAYLLQLILLQLMLRACLAVSLLAVLQSNAAAQVAGSAKPAETSAVRTMRNAKPNTVPRQADMREGYIHVDGAKLWYWDTGGDGQPVVLLHPATGSGLVWGFQQPVLVSAGYRVIGYSRKNHFRSAVTAAEKTSSDAEDLHRLVMALGLKQFHGIGLAAGGGILMEYSVAYPKTLRSMTVACSLGRVDDRQYWKLSASLRPPAFYDLPPEFRELSPHYRAADPQGVSQWVALQKKSRVKNPARLPAEKHVEVTWEKLKANGIPSLLLAGDSDLYSPPPMVKYFHKRMPESQMTIIQSAGHAAYWEQPASFNAAVLQFLKRH